MMKVGILALKDGTLHHIYKYDVPRICAVVEDCLGTEHVQWVPESVTHTGYLPGYKGPLAGTVPCYFSMKWQGTNQYFPNMAAVRNYLDTLFSNPVVEECWD